MGKRTPIQPQLWIPHTRVDRTPGHRFYEKLNDLLDEASFDQTVEDLCAKYYAPGNEPGRRSIPPGTYFRMLLVGYFEGIESERGIAWRCADSLSLRAFIRVQPSDDVPDHSTLSRIRTRLEPSVYTETFRAVLAIVEAKGLLRGKVVGVDSTYLRADASMKSIVRKDTGQTYPEYLEKLAREAGAENPTAEDCRRLDRKRKKKTSNKDWESATDPDARVARLKDGRTKLAYKPEHVVDLETGAIVAAPVHHADQADTATMEASLEAARENVLAVVEQAIDQDDDDEPPTPTGASEITKGDEQPTSSASTQEKVGVVGDKGYYKAELLAQLNDAGFRPYIPEPRRVHSKRHWQERGGAKTARAAYQNQARSLRKKAKALHRRRGELVERTFAHICETGGGRRTRLRGRANVEKRHLVLAAAANLALVMRTLFGWGTPKQRADALREFIRRCLATLRAYWPQSPAQCSGSCICMSPAAG